MVQDQPFIVVHVSFEAFSRIQSVFFCFVFIFATAVAFNFLPVMSGTCCCTTQLESLLVRAHRSVAHKPSKSVDHNGKS